MSNTYSILRESLNLLADFQMSLVQKRLEKMNDDEYNAIPTVIMSPDVKKFIETYGCTIIISRIKDGGQVKSDVIYCVFPSIFKIVV